MPRTREFVVLTLEGAGLVGTVHRLLEDRSWDADVVSQVRGTPCDFKSDAREEIDSECCRANQELVVDRRDGVTERGALRDRQPSSSDIFTS